ncbi:MAG: hypothetical protein JNK15_03810 [Planctomycetes bacterium]|nr:hypothetical protein [Planctomycetota bacterium]
MSRLPFAWVRRLAAALPLLAAACAVSQPDVPLRRFTAGDLEAVRTFAAREVENGDAENLALVMAVQAQCDLLAGRLDDARKTFDAVGQMMGTWATSGGEATAAILGSESSKTWKGDPYEKAMAAFYLAYCYLQKGEPDNARAACKRGILADGEVADEKYQADNALLFWMAGRMSVLMQNADADGFFREAAQAHSFALGHGARGDAGAAPIATPRAGNVVLVCECGMGPEKYGDGAQEELARFRPRYHPAVKARASVGGRSLGTSTILNDVDYQARTLGGTAMEGIREGKAVFKTASTVAGIVLLEQASRDRGHSRQAQAITGGALLLLGLLTSTAADVRHWPTLPATVQVLVADLPPGPHTVTVEFLDASGRVLPTLTQTRTVVVPNRGEVWQLFRSLPLGAATAARKP